MRRSIELGAQFNLRCTRGSGLESIGGAAWQNNNTSNIVRIRTIKTPGFLDLGRSGRVERPHVLPGSSRNRAQAEDDVTCTNTFD